MVPASYQESPPLENRKYLGLQTEDPINPPAADKTASAPPTPRQFLARRNGDEPIRRCDPPVPHRTAIRPVSVHPSTGFLSYPHMTPVNIHATCAPNTAAHNPTSHNSRPWVSVQDCTRKIGHVGKPSTHH